MPSLSSVIETMGRNRANNENNPRNQANAPSVINPSVSDIRYQPHCDGLKLLVREPAIITNRSSHIPMLMKIEMTHSAARFTRIRGENSSSGIRQLHSTITQKR